MNARNKSNEELINELQELQQAYNALKITAEADSIAQKQTMEALKASEERFQLLFNKAPLGYQSLDFDGHFIEVNQQWLDTLGYEREEVIGKWFGDFLTPVFKDGFRKRFPIFKEQGKIHSEFEMIHKNGSVLFIAFDGRIGYDVKGDFKQTHCILQDVTEVRIAEKELLKSREILNTMEKAAKIGGWEFDVETMVQTWTEEIFHILEIDTTHGAPTVPKGVGFLAPEYQPMALLGIQRAIEFGEPYNQEWEVITAKGNKRWVNAIATPYQENGKTKSVSGSFQDITKRKLAEIALLESEANLKAALENSQAGIAIAEYPSGKLKFVNKSALLIRDKKYDEIVKDIDVDKYVSGWQIFDFNGKPYQTNDVPLARAILYGETCSREFIVRRDNNEDRYVWANAAPIFNEKGVQTSAIVVFLDITDRKQAEEKLKLLEQKSYAWLENSPTCTKIVDLDFNLQYMSSAGIKGLKIDNITPYYGKPYPFHFYPEPFKTKMTGNMNLAKETGEVITQEAPVVDINGNEIWYQSTIVPVKNDNGRIEYLIIVSTDTTERKQAENALQKSEAEFRLLAEAMPQIVWITLPDGGTIFFNQKWVDYTGLSLKESYGAGWNKPFHPDDRQLAWDAWKNATTNLATYSLECRLRRFDGEYKWWLVRGVPMLDADGAVLKWFGTCTDIDEIKCSEAELIKSKEKAEENETYLRSVLQSTNDIIVSRDLNNNVVFFNKAFDNVTMELFNQHAIVGMNTLNLLTEKDRMYWESILQKVKNGENHEEEYRHTTLLKTTDYITAHVPVLLGSKVVGTLEITKDITLFKNREDELIEAKNHAMESDRLKSAFLANMSHEIRTPMNGILGFAELLKDPGLTGEKQQEYIKIIEKSGDRMLNIINNIVDISKIEANLMDVDIKDCNINEKIEFIYYFFKPQVEEKGMQLQFKNTLPAKEAIIQTDSEKVYSILTNLVKNAIKYSNCGTIEFGYIKRDETLEFFVKDTGIGIPKDRQSAIFERFIQADISDNMARQGAGLGLSISKAYVEMLGGKIWVECEEGIGSTFYFTLPYNALYEEKQVVQLQDKENQINPEVTELKVLIAEDDEASEMLITIDVEKFSKNVLIARTGNEAVEVSRNNPDIDLILMDILMPVMNGYEATRQIRQFNKNVVIIAQTAFGLSGDREKAIEAGCNDYLSKPINKDKLLSIIPKYFNK